MRRHDLDVERVVASIDVVLDAHVRELDVPLVVARQLVLPRPVLDLQRIAVRPAIAVVTIAIAFLQEWTHALGWEVRLEINGDLQRSEVFRSQDDVLTAGEAWKAAMIDKGWQ